MRLAKRSGVHIGMSGTGMRVKVVFLKGRLYEDIVVLYGIVSKVV